MTETYADPAQSNGQHAPLTTHFDADLPRVEFGDGATQTIPHEWAAWMLTTWREDEIAGRKPRPFSVMLAAAAMAAR